MSQAIKEGLAFALGRISSGVYIITSGEGESSNGMLATWVIQSGFAPPSVCIIVNKERPILNELKPGAAVVINILSKDNMDIFKAFAKPANSAAERFSELSLVPIANTPPVFSKAHAYISCRINSVTDAQDHAVLLAEVIDGQGLNPDAEPMLHTRKNGFQY